MSKYAKLGPQKGILHVIDTDLTPRADITGAPVLTNAQAAAIDALKRDNKRPIWYNNQVTTVEEQQAAGVLLRWDVVTKDFAVITPPARPAPVRNISKLAIRRLLRSWDRETAFEQLLDAVPHARSDWNDAQDIRTNDPIFVANKEAFKAFLSLTEEQFQEILSL